MGKFTQTVLNVDSLAPTEPAWELVESGTITIQDGDTSTTASTVKITNVEPEDGYMYLLVCDKKNPVKTTSGYIGNVSSIMKVVGAEGFGLSNVSALVRYYSSSLVENVITQSKGLILKGTLSSGKLCINKSYSGSYTQQWNGDSTYKLYKCNLNDALGE